MPDLQYSQIVLSHWNAGVFHAAALPQLLPEIAIYSLLYDEVLIREEDLLTNRAITGLLADERNFAVFSELLVCGLVKLLRLPLEVYPPGRRFDPVRLPISARAEEHQVRRSYKGSPWKPTVKEWQLFQRLDEIVVKHPASSRYHAPFPSGNPFAVQLRELLENRASYRLASHPVFCHLHENTADQFATFCRDDEAWLRFLRNHGAKNPIVGPDAGFYRSAAYQCSNFLPTPRAIRRLVESVYAAAYCERELSDGRYGGSELVELPYRYQSESEHDAAVAEAVRIELAPTEATAAISLQPGIATVLEHTRASPQFASLRRIVQTLGSDPESPLLAEARFRDAWRDLCTVYAENAAIELSYPTKSNHRIARFSVFAYVLARVLGFLVLPAGGPGHEPVVAKDAAVIAAIEKLGPKMLRSFRALVKIPALREQMDRSTGVRCSTVPLTVARTTEIQNNGTPNPYT